MALCGAPYTFSIRNNQQDINAIERQIDRSEYNPLFAINKTSDILDYYLQFQFCRDFKAPFDTTLTGYRKCIKRNIFSDLDKALPYANAAAEFPIVFAKIYIKMIFYTPFSFHHF